MSRVKLGGRKTLVGVCLQELGSAWDSEGLMLGDADTSEQQMLQALQQRHSGWDAVRGRVQTAAR